MSNIYNVFNEIIDQETYKKDVKPTIDIQSSEYKSQLKKILKTFFTEKGSKMPKRNLTIPYNSLKVTTLKNIDKQIIEYLNNNEFQCNEESYEIGMCTNLKGKQISIYSVLKQINDYDVEKLKTQLNEVDNDKAKEAIQKKIQKKKNFDERYLTHYSRINKMMNRVIVFTWVPRKIASQSTKVSWTSCTTLFNGKKRKFVPTGIEAGQFIAYLVDKGDENKLDKPMARLLIKPFITEEGTVFWYPQSKVYPPKGNDPKVNESFREKVEKFVKDRQNLNFNHDELVGATKLYDDEKQYDDFDSQKLKEKFPEKYKKVFNEKIEKKIQNEEEITFDDIKDAIKFNFGSDMLDKLLSNKETYNKLETKFILMKIALEVNNIEVLGYFFNQDQVKNNLEDYNLSWLGFFKKGSDKAIEEMLKIKEYLPITALERTAKKAIIDENNSILKEVLKVDNFNPSVEDNYLIKLAADAKNDTAIKTLLQDKRLELDKDTINILKEEYGKSNRIQKLIDEYFHGEINESFLYSISKVNKIFGN